MQVAGGCKKMLYKPFFEHRITGKSFVELGCSAEAIKMLELFEMNSNKSAYHIFEISNGWLNSNTVYELKQLDKLSRKFTKICRNNLHWQQFEDLDAIQFPCLYWISKYHRQNSPAPLCWVVGWLLTGISTLEIRKNGATAATLRQAQKIVIILKIRDLDLTDVENTELNIEKLDMIEINKLKAKLMSRHKTKFQKF